MKRLLSGFALAGGLMLLGMTTASAHAYCSLDPTFKVGLPVSYSLNVNLSTKLISTNVYASGTMNTTTFGGGLGIG
jgi:hypothetical protein